MVCRRIRWALALLIALAGCAYQPTSSSDTFNVFRSGPVQILAKRTPHDLGCPIEAQTFEELGMRTVGVTGCDNKATYKWVDDVGWVMDAGTER